MWLEKYETKRGTKWRVRGRQNGKKTSTAGGPNRVIARNIRDKIEEKTLLSGHGFVDKEQQLSFLIERYLEFCEKTKRPKTIEHNKLALGKLKKHLGERTLWSLKTTDIEQFRHGLLQKQNVNGTNMMMGAVAACFQYGVKMGYLEKNPAKGMQLPPVKVARFLNKAEIDTLLEACRFNKELYKIVKIALYTGMRQGEILAVTTKSISNGYIQIEKTKTDRPRMVPINTAIERDILTVNFSAWSKNRLTRAFGRAVKRSKLGRVRFHDLRHTFCSAYIQSGGTVADLREITGHTTLRSLQGYVHFQKNFLNERIQGLRFS